MVLLETPRIELLNMDCMEFMASCKDKQFSLAIVDPNYTDEFTIPANSKCAIVNKTYNLSSLNQGQPTYEYFDELKRISINQIIWGVNHYKYYLGAGRIVWDKDNTGVYSDAELAYHSYGNVTRIFKYRWNGMLQGDMKNKEDRIHPTQKPVKLYEWLLTNYAKPGDTILDTHGGSFSSAIAAYRLGFDFTGIELDKDYFDAAVKRFKEQTAQISLFPVKKPDSIQLTIE